MKFFKKAETVSDKKRTKAAELTLRESLYPIILVTTLFFLWVSFWSTRLPELEFEA